jgi:hypothetical protein
MNSPRRGLRVAAIILGVVCLGHLGRVLAHLHIQLGAWEVPQWPSVVAVVASGLICLWLWRLSLKLDQV